MNIHTIVPGLSTMSVGLFLDAVWFGHVGIVTLMGVLLGGWLVISGLRGKSLDDLTAKHGGSKSDAGEQGENRP